MNLCWQWPLTFTKTKIDTLTINIFRQLYNLNDIVLKCFGTRFNISQNRVGREEQLVKVYDI